MRRLLLAMILVASPALAIEPVAKVTGPTTATVGVPIYLDVSGSAFDPDTPLVVDFGDAPDKPTARILSGDDRKPTDVKVTAAKPGVFYAVVIAKGKPTTDAETVTRIAVLPLTVTDSPAPPTPGPTPTPDPRPPTPPPTPPPDPSPLTIGEQLGRSFGPKLAASLAEGFETAATMIAAGTSVKDADETLKAKFATARAAAFYELVSPTFAAVVPAGSEPKDAATRAAFAELHRDFAKGLRGAK